MKRGEKGYTLVELLLVTAIIGLVANATLMSLYQTLRTTDSSDNQVTTISQVQNAGYWISLDARRAETVEAADLLISENVTVSWDRSISGSIDWNDRLWFAFSADGGNNWGDLIESYHGPYPPDPTTFSYIIPAEYLTSDFRMRYYLDNFSNWDEYIYLDNITIARSETTLFYDKCSNFDSWDRWNVWQIYSGKFRGHGTYHGNRYLTMNTSLDLTPPPIFQLPLTFTWTTWTETGGNEYEVTYTIVDGKLLRSCSIDGGDPTETLIARHIDSDPDKTYCTLYDNELTLIITASLGSGLGVSSETREFRVLTRPD
jgi:prepilin-type N-terminal cleavage/methylation domain-containing protein